MLKRNGVSHIIDPLELVSECYLAGASDMESSKRVIRNVVILERLRQSALKQLSNTNVSEKECSNCLDTKHISEFYKNICLRSGFVSFTSRCKICENEYRRPKKVESYAKSEEQKLNAKKRWERYKKKHKLHQYKKD